MVKALALAAVLICPAAVRAAELPLSYYRENAEVMTNTAWYRAARNLEKVEKTPVEFGGFLMLLSYEGAAVDEIVGKGEQLTKAAVEAYLARKSAQWKTIARTLHERAAEQDPNQDGLKGIDPSELATRMAAYERFAAYAAKADLIVADVDADIVEASALDETAGFSTAASNETIARKRALFKKLGGR